MTDLLPWSITQAVVAGARSRTRSIATMLNLNAGILAAVPRVVPPHSVIAALARAANQRQALVARRHTEIATLVNTRDALLPRLLSGDLSAAGGERVRTAKA